MSDHRRHASARLWRRSNGPAKLAAHPLTGNMWAAWEGDRSAFPMERVGTERSCFGSTPGSLPRPARNPMPGIDFDRAASGNHHAGGALPLLDPLDAGALLQTLARRLHQNDTVGFQSPRCRGASSDMGGERNLGRFNPLDAGALLQTTTTRCISAASDSSFQSPRCRGASSDSFPYGKGNVSAVVSIPSMPGRFFRLSKTMDWSI